MSNYVYPSELQVNKVNVSDTEASFLDLHLSVSDVVFFQTKMFDKWDDFDFDILNFPFLDDGVPCSTSYGVNISQFALLECPSSNVVHYVSVLCKCYCLKNRLDFSDLDPIF